MLVLLATIISLAFFGMPERTAGPDAAETADGEEDHG